MAEAILYNVAADFIVKLSSHALQELRLIWGVDDELHKLQSTLSTIQAVLIDAEEQQFKLNAVKDWISKLKDAFYDVDDLIDEFSYESLRRQIMTKGRRKSKQVRIFFSKSNQIAFGFKMGQKIKEIKSKLDVIAAEKSKFNFSENKRDIEVEKRADSHSYIPEGEVIGRGDDKKKIIDLLLNTNTIENVSVCAIVGMGGLGKTALAQSVYNDKRIDEHFELKLWVCISEVFDAKIIVGMIIESATNNKPEAFQMETLQKKLRENIDGKKYLLIMDDVWNEDNHQWRSLKDLLVCGAKGSKIVITTRSEKVADGCDADELYSLNSLSEEHSWLLFSKMAFKGREELENPELVEIGKAVVSKLKGVPLAIRVIGRLLHDKKSKDYWLSFKENEMNLVTVQGNELQDNEMQQILMFSYNRLPFNLKQCFTYCALFPKDYEFEIDDLINQWIAQGFVREPRDHMCKSVKDVGCGYLMELLWRSFFQDAYIDEWGDIKYCKMHDLMHDLACSIVEGEYVIANDENKHARNERRTRHMSVRLSRSNEWEHLESIYKAKDLRTLQFINDVDNYISNTVHEVFCKVLRLRSLCLTWQFTIKKLPESIGKLKYLRYLNLAYNSFSRLPNSITQLYNLETLVLRHSEFLRELPRDSKNWIRLRHLDLGHCNSLICMPKGLGGLTRLQTLNQFIVGENHGGGLSELNGLKNLRGSLTIRGLDFCTNTELNTGCLKEMSQLRKLQLEWNSERDASVSIEDERLLECLQPHSNLHGLHLYGYGGVRLSDWLSYESLALLVSIELSQCLNLQHLPQFCQFPNLKKLWLEYFDSIEYIDNMDSISSPTFFPSLEDLSIKSMPKLKRWWKGEIFTELAKKSISLPKFPCLSQLTVLSCPNLTFIPSHPPLQLLEIGGVGVEFLEMVVKMILSPLPEFSSTPAELHSLTIWNVEEIEFLSKDHFSNLKTESLAQQHILNEDNLGILRQKLSNLRELILSGISKMEYLPNILQHVASLQYFLVSDCEKLVSLPEWIGNLTSLIELRILDCPKLTSLPEGMRHLTSLSRLDIRACNSLSCLPEGMCHLTSLTRLVIDGCPLLSLRCKKEKGEDWPKIAHVPNLELE